MFRRLALVLMLVLLPLQWGLAQAHDAAEEIVGLAFTVGSAAAHGEQPDVVQTEQGAHAQEPGGICQFHDLAHTVGLAAQGLAWVLPARRAACRLPGLAGARLPAGWPDSIERPRWSRHAPAVADFQAPHPTRA